MYKMFTYVGKGFKYFEIICVLKINPRCFICASLGSFISMIAPRWQEHAGQTVSDRYIRNTNEINRQTNTLMSDNHVHMCLFIKTIIGLI